MPYTAQQRKLFHVLEDDPEAAERHGVSQHEAGKLADEADAYAREGKERKPVKAKGFIDLSDIFA
jgi:hypothetical protein